MGFSGGWWGMYGRCEVEEVEEGVIGCGAVWRETEGETCRS